MAALIFAVQAGIPLVAAALGYEAHPGYQNPFREDPNGVHPLVMALAVPVMFPIAEEVLFRVGLLGGIHKLLSRPGVKERFAFWTAAVLSSIVFVVVHETQDPVLMAARLAGALLLSQAYRKGGYLASVFTHGVINLQPTLLMMALWTAGEAGMGLALLGELAALAVLAFLFSRRLRRDARAGSPVSPYPLTPSLAGTLAVILWAGVAMMWNVGLLPILWGVPALWLTRRSLRNQPPSGR